MVPCIVMTVQARPVQAGQPQSVSLSEAEGGGWPGLGHLSLLDRPGDMEGRSASLNITILFSSSSSSPFSSSAVLCVD